MVLGAFMKKWRIYLLFLFIPMAACANSTTSSIDGNTMHLYNNAGMCQLVVPSKKIQLNLLIPWPCQFHKNDNGKLRIHEELKKKYFLVESSVPHPDLLGDCITQLQSIVVEGSVFRQSEFKDTVALCPPFVWDTKVFTGLFSED